jgi:hypothetical protein
MSHTIEALHPAQSRRITAAVPQLPSAARFFGDMRLALLMVFAFAAMLVLPVAGALAACACCSALAALAEARAARPPAILMVLTGAFGIGLAASLAEGPSTPFLEPAASAIVLLALLVRFGRRAAAMRSVAGPSAVLHKLAQVTAAIWLGLYTLCLAVVALSALGSWWLGLELALLSAGLGLVATVTLVDFGASSRRQREFEINAFTFRQVEGDESDAVLAFYAAEIADAIASSNPEARETWSRERILAMARRVDAAPGSGKHFYFTASHAGRVIGVMAIAIDEAGRLPIEAGLGTSLDPLRRFGRVAEGRRAAIDKEFRFHPDVLLGLLKCVFDVTLDHDVAFLVTHAFTFVAGMYAKTGYQQVRLGKRTPLFDQPAHLMLMNLAALFGSGGGDARSTRAVAQLLNTYLLQRWLCRAALRRRTARAAQLDAAALAPMLAAEVDDAHIDLLRSA